jgi:predicted PurR-regulated permease PerM
MECWPAMSDGLANAPAASPAPASAPRRVSRELLFQVFFFAVFGFLLYQLARVLAPFMASLTGALIVALIFYPLHVRLRRRLRPPSAAACVTTLLALTTIIVPLLTLGWLLFREAAEFVPTARDLLRDGAAAVRGDELVLPAPLERLWDLGNEWLARARIDVRQVALDGIRQLGNTMTELGTAMVRNVVLLMFDVIVLVFALFFFLRDGPATSRRILDLVPMEEASKNLILERLYRTLAAIVRGAFLTASTQGVLAGAAFAVAGVRFPVLLGFATALFAVVPILGAAAVWAPVGLYLWYVGDTGAGIGVLLWGALVVSLSDNFLRPYLIGEHAQLPILLLFVGILGGLQVYGVAGALISPLLIASVLAFAAIFREQYGLGRGR